MLRRHDDLAAAEDAVQEALIAAATGWPARGLPDNPLGWLIHVALRRVADHVRAEVARRRREGVAHSLAPAEDHVAEPWRSAPGDDSLDLLFMCCHPALSPASAIALTLRAVGGLTTAEIARAFMVPTVTMGQRISRAKQAIREAGARFEPPTPETRAARLRQVLHVLYLIFNEGYAASSGAAPHRPDLAAEALRLCRMLCRLAPDDGEAVGLLALMRLTDARRAARTGPHGELVPLDEQDRSRWDRAAIDEGQRLLAEVLPRGRVGPYQVQAAIAALHDEAPTFEQTDWPQIVGLYGLLRQMADNPMVELSHAIAYAMVHGPAAGLQRLDALAADPRLAGHHRLDAARGHLLERAGDVAGAVRCLRRAAAATTSVAERDFLRLRAARLAALRPSDGR